MILLLWRGFLVVVLSAILGILVNTVSPDGIPLFGPVPLPDAGGLNSVSAEDAYHLFQEKSCVFVDARSEEEFCQGHIPGAQLLTQDDFDETISTFRSLIPQNTPLVTYCSGQGCGSSVEVAEMLLEDGYLNVKIFFGGWELWKQKGYPVVKENNSHTAG